MSAENNDLDDLLRDAGLGLDLPAEETEPTPAPAKKAPAKKAAAKKVDPTPEPEVSEVSPEPTVTTVINNPAPDLEEIKAQLRAELLAELKAEPVFASGGVLKGENGPELVNFTGAETVVPKLPDIIHIVEDGFTIENTIFYRGQEYRPQPGDTWAALSPREQRKRYGRMKFKQGPWDGEGYDLEDENLTEQEREILRRVEEKRQAQAQEV